MIAEATPNQRFDWPHSSKHAWDLHLDPGPEIPDRQKSQNACKRQKSGLPEGHTGLILVLGLAYFGITLYISLTKARLILVYFWMPPIFSHHYQVILV